MRFRRKNLGDLIHDHVAGDLDPSNARALEERIQREPKVRALYEEIAETHEALRSLCERPEPPIPASDAVGRIHAAIARDLFRTRPELTLESQGARFYRRVAVAATLLCALTVGALVMNNLARKKRSASPVVATDRLTAEGRGLLPFVEAGSRGALNGAEFIRLLERTGQRPHDVHFTPNDQVMPIAAISSDER